MKKAILIALLLALTPTSTDARPALCTTLSEALEQYRARFGEEVVGAGNSANGYVVMLLLNPETGTFTLIAVDGNRCARRLDSGDAMTITVLPTDKPI